jgi:uncharacterized protein YndB with AHSA1/START domain
MSHNINIEKLLPATTAQVMQMLTDQKQIAIWSGEDAVFEAKVGGQVSLFAGWVKGCVQLLSEDELKYTWRTSEWEETTADSIVHITLKAVGEQTKLCLQHSLLPDQDESKNQLHGWEDFFFVPLEDYLMVRFNA